VGYSKIISVNLLERGEEAEEEDQAEGCQVDRRVDEYLEAATGGVEEAAQPTFDR